MKTALIILLTIFLSNSLCANELEWVDEQIEAIKPPRKGVNIHALGSPFVFLEKNKTEKKDAKKGSRVTAAPAKKAAPSKTASLAKTDDAPKKRSLVLSTIINSSAMIDGNWYKVSDKINSYTVTEITKTSVTLKQGAKELLLSTLSTNPNLKFKNK